jgi:hypothetical protein
MASWRWCSVSFDRERISEATSDFVLQRENVARRSAEAFGPDVAVGNGVNELGVDPDLVRRALDTAFETGARCP